MQQIVPCDSIFLSRHDLLQDLLCCWNCCPRRCRTWRSGRMVGLNSCQASAASCFTSRNFRGAARKSARDRIGPTSPWLFKLIFHNLPYLSVLAEWQHTSGLVLRVRLGACKTLQSVPCQSANFDRFKTPENVGGCIRFLSCAASSSIDFLGFSDRP